MRTRGSRDRKAAAISQPPLIRRIGLLLDALPEAVVTTDREHRLTGWNGAAERILGFSSSTMVGASVFEILARELRSATVADLRAVLDRGEAWSGGALARNAAGAAVELSITAAPVGRPDAPRGHVVVARDITSRTRAERTAEAAEAHFAEFMAAAPAIAFIKDHEGRYVFANEHARRLTGDRIGLLWPGMTDYDLWPPTVAAQIRENDALTLAGTVPLEFIQVVPLDDGPHTLLLRKFPLRAATGEPLMGGIGLDITDRVRSETEIELGHEREAHASLLARERAVVADGLVRLRASGTVETVATSITRLVLGLPGIGIAAILLFELDGRTTPVGLALASGPPPERRSVPLARSRTLRKRAQVGPWVEAWRPATGHPLNEAIRTLGISFLGYAPIRWRDDLVGILAVGAAGPSAEIAVTERLPAIVEFAGLAGAFLGSSVASRFEQQRARSDVQAVIDQGGFQPVFQPIVELAGRTTVGYEALTRFRDGVPPNVRFAEAAAVGLGFDLEVATIRAILLAAARLPTGPYLSINVSPGLVLAGRELSALLRSADRPIVCEVTEHAAIEDYAAFRAAIAGLHPVRMAVDDAGAGFASIRHIIELRPALVKLDRSFVAGIDGDPVRQALIVGMRHFALSAGFSMVAEGIETEAEMAALLELQVPFGQGYLLGRPAPAPRKRLI